MKKVMIFGTFDRLHPGHRFVIEEAEKRGQVTAIIGRETNVKRMKGKAPLESEQVRKKNLERLFPTITVLLGDQKDFLAPVLQVKPDLILLGYDQKLPPGVLESDLRCNIQRLPGYYPELYKSSLTRKAR